MGGGVVNVGGLGEGGWVDGGGGGDGSREVGGREGGREGGRVVCWAGLGLVGFGRVVWVVWIVCVWMGRCGGMEMVVVWEARGRDGVRQTEEGRAHKTSTPCSSEPTRNTSPVLTILSHIITPLDWPQQLDAH